MSQFGEEVGESSSPASVSGSMQGSNVVADICEKLSPEGNPELLHKLEAHFLRMPPSYQLYMAIRAEDVLLHLSILAESENLGKHPAFGVRLMKLDELNLGKKKSSNDVDDGNNLTEAHAERYIPLKDFKPSEPIYPCKLDELNLGEEKNSGVLQEGKHLTKALSARCDTYSPIHEITFSTLDKPKLLSQLSALLSSLGLNIKEAHIFTTTDGYSLCMFVVNGWRSEDTEGLSNQLDSAIATSKELWSNSNRDSVVKKMLACREKILAAKPEISDWEIDKSLLKIEVKIASGSFGDLYCGSYFGQDVCIKILRSEHLTEDQAVGEFAQEVIMLREIAHRNIVRFIGAWLKPPQICIVTEHMCGGSLYHFLHHHNHVELPLLLKFAIDICQGMNYLHQKDIIHRDLKTANLLLDHDQAVKVADFGVSRFVTQGISLTPETGTYRYMAPEILKRQPYNKKADVYSFGIVLWELMTSKIPFGTLNVVQAALTVIEGGRPEIPERGPPLLLDLLCRCWHNDPAVRPTFAEIIAELELLLDQDKEERKQAKKKKKKQTKEQNQ